MNERDEHQLHENVKRYMATLSRKELIKIVKEAFVEFLNDNAKDFGWWTIKTLGGFSIVVIVGLWVYFHGSAGR